MFEHFRHSDFTSLLSRMLVRRIPSDPQEAVHTTGEANSAKGIAAWHNYSYKSMNARGDIWSTPTLRRYWLLLTLPTRTAKWPSMQSSVSLGCAIN